MYVVEALIVVAMVFFLFLPITDRKTVRMKLAVLCALASIFTVSIAGARAPAIKLAGLVRSL